MFIHNPDDCQFHDHTPPPSTRSHCVNQKERVAFARAVLSAPRLLLLDEPTSSLDARLKTRLIPYLKRIRDDFRIPLIYVTHDSSELGALCDEVLIVESGRIIQRGLLEARGARVVAEDINPSVNDIFANEERILPFVGDVATEDAAQQSVALAVDRFGRLDILVNNAASIVYKNAVDTKLDEWNSILGVTSTGVFLHSREALKVMIPNKTGSIINIGSYACYQTFPGISAYAAAKGALAQITRTLALEAIGHGMRVNAVRAGDVVTNLLNTFRDDGREFLVEHGKLAPIKRAAQPEEIAEVVAFLASEKASFIVGAIVMADGGMSVIIQ